MTFRICDGAFPLMTHSNRKYFLDARLENEWVFSHTLSYQSQECFFLTRKNMSGVPAPQVSIPIRLTGYSKRIAFVIGLLLKCAYFYFILWGCGGRRGNSTLGDSCSLVTIYKETELERNYSESLWPAICDYLVLSPFFLMTSIIRLKWRLRRCKSLTVCPLTEALCSTAM